MAYKTSKGMYYFVKRSALATLAVCYFSYLSITKVAVMVFYCIGVRTGDSSAEDETSHWALDTSIHCANPDHKSLMVFGGVLFVLFSVGFPLISAFILVLCRKGSGSRDPQWMTDILGFLYRAYKREFVYWESTVMLRKALLSAIAVFSYHLGGHSQGLLASCILSVCLFLQAIYKPYRVEFGTVNNIESLSLLISGLTFTLAQFFMKDRTNEAVKVALAVFLMISIIVFFIYLMVRMWVCLIDVLRTDLRVRGALLDDEENSLIVVGSLVVSMLGLSSRPRDSDDDDDELAAAELGSMKGNKNDDSLSDK